MTEHVADFEWRGEGQEAEIVVYASDERAASSAFERALPAARLPGVEGPVYAAASPRDFGCVAVSLSHASADLLSTPVRGVLLLSDAAASNLEVPPGALPRLVRRGLEEVRLPGLAGAGVRRLCETGAVSAAEDGLIEEEDLALLAGRAADADALDRRALSAGARDWDLRGEIRTYAVGAVHNPESTGSLGLEAGRIALVVLFGAGELGRLGLAAHRERILSRVRQGDPGPDREAPAVPREAEEAADLLVAVQAVANFADGRTALAVYALRRALGGVVGDLRVRAAWVTGGVEDEKDGLMHRTDLVRAGDGDVYVSGGDVGAAKGMMHNSAPPFGVPGDGSRPWEEAGLLERWAELDPLERKG